MRYDYDGYSDLTAVYGRDGKKLRGFAYRNHINEDGKGVQQALYFHCDQIGIPREMTDKDGNLV